MDSDESIDHMAGEITTEIPVKLTRNINKNVLHSFNKLACPIEKDRLEAGVSILKHLVDKQEESQDDEICTELKYAVQRLVRGMGTSRLDARNGFYSTFVSLLSTFPQINTEKVMEFVTKELVSTEKSTKGEKGEELTGQVLVYGALIQSGVLTRAAEKTQRDVLTKLVTCAGRRSYLPVIVYSFLKILMDQMDVKRFRKVLWPVMDPVVRLPWPQQTLDTLYFLLTAGALYPAVVGGAYLAEHLGTSALVSAESLPHCCQMLMCIPRRICLLHPVLEELCVRLVAAGLVEHFWDTVLEPHLTKSCNKTKELVTAQLFRHTLKHVADKNQIAVMLTPSVVSLLLRPGPKKRAERDEAAARLRQCTEQLVAALQDSEDEAVVACITRVLFWKGHFHVDQATAYSLIRQMTACLKTSAGVKKLAKVYQKVLEAKSGAKTEAAAEANRVAAAQLYTRLVGHPTVQARLEWKAKRLHLLLRLGLFTTAGLSPTAAGQIKECFYRALDQKAASLDSLRSLLSLVVYELDEAVADEGRRAELRQPIAAKTVSAWNLMTKVARELETKSQEKLSADPLFHIMFLHLGLQLFSDQKMATEALEELHSCYERVASSKATKKKKKKLKEGDLEADEPEWVEVTVELLLSLLSTPQHLLRSVVMCVFPHLCPHLTPSAIQQILQVFDTKSDRNLLSTDDDDPDPSDSESDPGSESGSESSAGEEDLFDDDVGEKETVTDKLRLAVRQALGTAASLTDEESVDLDDISDGEGKRLDSALSDAFKLMRDSRAAANPRRAKQSRPDTAQMHFRTRALYLLEAVLAAPAPMAACLDMVAPLLGLLEFCVQDAHQKPLETRTRACLKKLAGVKSWSSALDVTEEHISALLSSLLSKGERTAPIYLDMLEECSLCCVFLVRCSMHLRQAEQPPSTEQEDPVTLQLASALQDFMSKRECLLSASLFKSTLQLSWLGNWRLAGDLAQLALAGDVRIYKRQQALQLLRAFYLNHRLLQDPAHADTLAQISARLLKSCTQLLTSQADVSNPLLKATYLTELLGLLKQVLKSPGQSATSKAWAKLGTAVSLLAASRPLSAAVVAAVRALASVLHVTVTLTKVSKEPIDQAQKKGDKKKNKPNRTVANGNSSDSEVEATHVVKDKVKKRKTNFDLKKESKQLRLNAMSEGFEHTNFSVAPEINIDRVVNGNTNGNTVLNSKKTEKRKHSIESPGRKHKKTK